MAAAVSSQDVSMPSTRMFGLFRRRGGAWLHFLCILRVGRLKFPPSRGRPLVIAAKSGFQSEVKSYMPHVRVKENEPFDVALRRFKRACEKAGVLTEVRRREFYEKPTQERKRKQAAAVKRHAKKLSREVARR